MRDRAPRICGVGVWSLLLSLCLASLTHAHRSHTGRCLYAFPPAGLPSRSPRSFHSPWTRRLQFLFTCRRFGVNRPRRHPRERRRRIEKGSKDHRGWLPRTHEKFFNIRKESMSNPARKVLSVQGHSRLFSHRGGDTPECLQVTAMTACAELCGSEIPACVIPVLCVPSGLVTSRIGP